MALGGRLNLMATTGSNADVTGEKKGLPPRARNCVGFIKTVNQDAATTVTGKIQHSADGENWEDYLSFTAINATSGDEIKYHANNPPPPIMPCVRALATVAGATKLADITIDLRYEEYT